MVSLSTSIYFAGVMIGGVLFGAASDAMGRLPVMLFTLFMPVVLGVMLFFVENFILFIIIRCLIGICMQVKFMSNTSDKIFCDLIALDLMIP